MYNPFQLGVKYIRYFFSAMNGKGHGVHSPFVYDFIEKVLNNRSSVQYFNTIEQKRETFRADKTVLKLQDYGAGSRISSTSERTVKKIASSSLKPKKFGQLFFKIVQHYQYKSVVELGTSLGISTAYFAMANKEGKVFTFEGAEAVAALAEKNFQQLGLNNIEIIRGNFDETLLPFLSTIRQLDVAYIDGNHRYEPTIRYFLEMLPKMNEYGMMILDDIHWSSEMEKAWQWVQQHEAVTTTIDLFFIGIVLFRKEFKIKQHFTVRF